MKHSPLEIRHLELGAKMADFGGWQMPIEYPGGGVLTEHQAVREKVGIFDVSHLGKIWIKGSGALDFVNSVITNDLNRISDGQAQYSLLCNETGGVIDDLIVYRFNSSQIFIIPNAANCEKVFEIFKKEAPANLELDNAHEKYAVIAVQGPESKKLLESLGISLNLEYMSHGQFKIENIDLIICRTGYSGEHGYELLPKVETHSRFGIYWWPMACKSVVLEVETRYEPRWVIRFMARICHQRLLRSRREVVGQSVLKNQIFMGLMRYETRRRRAQSKNYAA